MSLGSLAKLGFVYAYNSEQAYQIKEPPPAQIDHCLCNSSDLV